MAKIFAKFGAKRDENLGDLGSTDSAINILLDRIKGGNDSFTIDDLELIKNIFNTDITTDTFTDAAAATVEVTNPETGVNGVYEPLITLQNRFDRAYFTTSEPFFIGGAGLTARYLDNPQILRTVPGDATTDFTGYDQYYDPVTGRADVDPVTGVERAIQKDNFWEEGDFVYGNKIVNKLLSSYGGVEWTGYYKPSISGNHSIVIRTTGFVKVEFDNKEAPSKDFTLLFGDPDNAATFTINDKDFTNGVGGTGLTTILDQTRLEDKGIITDVSVTSTVTADVNASYGPFAFTSAGGSGASFNLRRDATGTIVENIQEIIAAGGQGYVIGEQLVITGDQVGGSAGVDDITIEVTGVGGYDIYDTIAADVITTPLGTQRNLTINLGQLTAYVPYKIRVSFFIDEDAVEKMQETQVNGALNKSIQFEQRQPNTGGNDEFDYKFLYDEKYFDFYNIGDFKKFVDQSLSVGGTKIDGRGSIGDRTSVGGNPEDNYFGLANLNPIVSYYISPLNKQVSDLQTKRFCTYPNGDRNITVVDYSTISGPSPEFEVNNVPNRTEGIEIGNYAIGPNIPIGTRVAEVINNSSVLLDVPVTGSSPGGEGNEIKFVNHKGLVAFGTAGQYSTDIVSGGLVESGFSLGQRQVDRVIIKEGAKVVESEALQVYSADLITLTPSAASGTNAVLQLSRNQFGALVVTINNAGSGFTNYKTYEVDATPYGQPGETLLLQVANLNDTFLTGEPEFIFTKDQVLKEENIADFFTYSDQTDPDAPVNRQSVETLLIDRIQNPAEVKQSLENNSIVFENQSYDVTSLDDGTSREWYVYQTFGLNNDALASYCQGVYAKRILRNLVITNGGNGYTTSFLFDGSDAVSTSVVLGDLTDTGMTVYYEASGGVVQHAWVVDEGNGGYAPGTVVSIQDGDGLAEATIGYVNDNTTSIELRLTDAKDLAPGQFAHLFPAIAFSGPDVNNLTSDVTITNIDWSETGGFHPNDPAAYVTISRPSGDVLNTDISYVSSTVTRVTFSPTSTNKEVCFRPTDTSPPFSATARGLSTSFDVKMVLDFSSSSDGSRAGDPNISSKLTFSALELETDRGNNEFGGLDATAVYAGSIPLETPDGTYHMLLWGNTNQDLTP